MKYVVELSERAERDIREYSNFIAGIDSIDSAIQWITGLRKVAESLQEMPGRFPIAPESEDIGVEIRHRIYHSHRILYHVDNESRIVTVVHVRHAARRPLDLADLEPEDL